MSENPHGSPDRTATKAHIREILFTNRLANPPYCRCLCCDQSRNRKLQGLEFCWTNHQWPSEPPIYNVPEYFTRPVQLVDATKPDILKDYEAEIMDKSYLVAIAHCMFVGERINTYYSDFCPLLIVPGQILFSKKKYSYYRSVFEKEFETVLAFKEWTKIEIYLQHQMDFAFNLSEKKVNVLNDKIFCINMHVEPCPEHFCDEMKICQMYSEKAAVGPIMKIEEFNEDQHEEAYY